MGSAVTPLNASKERATVAGELALSMMAISQPYSAWVIFLGMNFLLSYLGKVRK